MPSKRSYSTGSHGPSARRRPFEAKVQLVGVNYYLGSFLTYGEAKEAEEAFKRGLIHITQEAHEMWKQRQRFQQSVVRVRDNADAGR